MADLSPKMLTQTLRRLERDGLVRRDVRSIVPVHVQYELTTMAANVMPILENLCHWAKENSDNRDAARRRFDQASKSPSDR
jgi:DNA-binding HxlR family transcriptional regulator